MSGREPTGGAAGGWVEFDWVVVRLVPSVHREQFVNVGVLLHARTAETILARIEPDWDRVRPIAADLDRAEAERQLDSLRRIVAGGPGAAPIGLLPPSERFHWLTAPRSAVIQTSDVRPGRCTDLRKALDRLFDEQCRMPSGGARP
jgi:hypothetical protein